MNVYESNLTGNQIDTGINNTNILSNNLSTLTTNFNNLNTNFNNLTPADISAMSLGALSQIPANADLNNYYTPGQYGVVSNDHATSITNIPIEQAGMLLVYAPMGIVSNPSLTWFYIAQRYLAFDNLIEYKRLGATGDTPNNLIWSSWKKIMTVDNIYPIGAIYISTSSTNPGTLFGGTWTQISDKFLLAAGSTYTAGDTGGEANHTLTAAESGIQSHTHEPSNGSTYGFLTYLQDGGITRTKVSVSSGTRYAFLGNSSATTADGSNLNYAGATAAASGNATSAHNNMPPYLTVYMWQRTA